jgi:CelD/BcsL family acetyltransferase involved in cellulose biosynthesis
MHAERVLHYFFDRSSTAKQFLGHAIPKVKSVCDSHGDRRGHAPSCSSTLVEPRMSPGFTAAWSLAAPASQPARQTTALAFEWTGALDFSPEDAAVVELLINQRPEVGVFLSQAWLSGFFAEPPSGYEPSLLTFRDAGVLRGFIPLAIRSTFSHTRVMLLGGEAGSDRTDLLACRGYEAACADTFIGWLAASFGRRGFILELRNVPGESPLWSAVHRSCIERGARLIAQPDAIHALPYLDLTEAFMANAASPRESHVLQKRRPLEKRGHLTIDLLDDEAEVLSAFDSLVRFLHLRWRGCGEESGAGHPRMQRFHRHVLPRLLAEGRLRMLRLSCDTRTIGVFYGVGAAHWWGGYLAGYDREWAGEIQLGQIVIASAIEFAAEQGAGKFDFLNGLEGVRAPWTVRDRVSVDAQIYSAGSGAQFTRALHATRQAASALVKSACNIPPYL